MSLYTAVLTDLALSARRPAKATPTALHRLGMHLRDGVDEVFAAVTIAHELSYYVR